MTHAKYGVCCLRGRAPVSTALGSKCLFFSLSLFSSYLKNIPLSLWIWNSGFESKYHVTTDNIKMKIWSLYYFVY